MSKSSQTAGVAGPIPLLSMERLIEAVPIGTMILDAVGRISLVNNMMLHKFGYGRDQLLGQFASFLLEEENLNNFVHEPPSLNDPAASPITTRVVTGKHQDGRTFPCEIRIRDLAVDIGHGVFMVSTQIAR